MSRRHRAEKREILPDPKFGDQVIAKFTNSVMYQGKKSAAEAIVYGALDKMQQKTGQDPVRLFHEALGHVNREVTADTPLYAVFDKGNVRTYVAYLHRPAGTVIFSDGYKLTTDATGLQQAKRKTRN